MPSSKLITLTLFASAPAYCQADDGRLPTFQSPVNTTRISQTVVKNKHNGALRDEELKQEGIKKTKNTLTGKSFCLSPRTLEPDIGFCGTNMRGKILIPICKYLSILDLFLIVTVHISHHAMLDWNAFHAPECNQ